MEKVKVHVAAKIDNAGKIIRYDIFSNEEDARNYCVWRNKSLTDLKSENYWITETRTIDPIIYL